MKFTSLFVVALVSASAFGKITYFSSADAMKHVLSSKVIAENQMQGKKLAGLDFAKASMTVSGPKGIDEQFDVNLQYLAHRSLLPVVCNFTATVKCQKAKPAPGAPGIVATELSDVTLSEIKCAH